MEQQTGSKLGKENVKAAYCHPAYLTYMQSAAAAAKSLQSCPTLCDPIDSSPPGSPVHHVKCWTGRSTAGNKKAGRNNNNLSYADDTTLMAESEEELKCLLMKVKVESEKVGLKLNIQKTKVMASGPITSREIDGEIVETVADFILGAPKSLQMVTVAMKLKDAYSLEGKL